MSLEVVEGGRDGSDGGGDGVNSCGVGLLCNARAGRRADPALRRPPPPSAACTAAHIAARPAALLCALLRRASASARLADSAPSQPSVSPPLTLAKSEAEQCFRPSYTPLYPSPSKESILSPPPTPIVSNLYPSPSKESILSPPTDPLLPKKSTMPGSHPNQIPGDLFTPEANKTSAEPLESPETPSHPSRLSWTGSQNMEGDLAMRSSPWPPTPPPPPPPLPSLSAAPPAQPRIARFSLPGVQTLADEESDDEDELEASPAQPTTAMHFEEQIGGGKWKEPPIERTPTKLRTKVTLTERAGQELRESAKSRAAAGEAALAAAAAAPADNTVADLAANALADPLPHPDDHRGLIAPTFVERVVPGSGEPYDARFNRFLEVGGFAEEPLPPPPPGHRIAARAAGSSRHASPAPAHPASPPPAPPAPRGPPPPAPPAPRAPLHPAPRPRPASLAPRAPGPVEAFSAPAAPPLRSAVPPTADEHDSAPVDDPPSALAADSPAAPVADSSSADVIPPAVDVGGRPTVQQRREMDECITQSASPRSWVLRAFVKNVNVTSVSPRRGNAWNLYQAYSHSDEHEKAEYARALRVNEDLEDGEEPSRQQWQLTYDDFYLEFGEENADEILVTFGQLRHLGAQTHAQRARLFSKLFRNQEKLLLRTFENHGFEGCTILAGPILNEDAQVAKVSFTPGMKALPATLRMTEGDFLGACKLTAYSNQMGVINDLAALPPLPAPPSRRQCRLTTVPTSPLAPTPAAAAGPSTSVVTKKKLKPPANYDGLTSGEKAALQKRLAKERVGKLDSRKDQLRVRLAQASIADVGFNAFLKQNGGGFLWTSLGRELLKRRVRIVGYPVDARLPAQTKARKGSSAWRILDLNAFNRALQARSSAGHGLRLEKIPDSVPMGKGKEAGSTIVIATHDYNVPVPPGPISAVVARMRSSMGVAMPVMDGLDKMWMASFDLEKQQVPIRPAAFTDADALRLETAAMAQGGNEDDEDFEDGDVEDDGEEDDGDRDDGDGDDEDEDGDGNEDEAPTAEDVQEGGREEKGEGLRLRVGRRNHTPAPQISYHHEEKRRAPRPRRASSRPHRAACHPCQGQRAGGRRRTHSPCAAPRSKEGEGLLRVGRGRRPPCAATRSKEGEDVEGAEGDGPPRVGRGGQRPYRFSFPPAPSPHEAQPPGRLQPRIRAAHPAARNVVQAGGRGSMASPDLAAPPQHQPRSSWRDAGLVDGRCANQRRRAFHHPHCLRRPPPPATIPSSPAQPIASPRSAGVPPPSFPPPPTASVDPPAGDNPFQSGPTDRKSAKRRRAPATSAAPDVGSSGSSRAPAAVAPIPGSSVRPPVAGGSSSARLRGPAAPAVAPAATTHAPAGSAIPPRPRSRTTAASGAMRAPAAPSATFAPARPCHNVRAGRPCHHVRRRPLPPLPRQLLPPPLPPRPRRPPLPQRSRRPPPVTTFAPAAPATSATAAPAAAPLLAALIQRFWSA
ncbi:hypothetical protein B0H14DRAFT_2565823 [Mycena olivaceomarginata]|nr:hypothetical protein B0H14DRAFT_2565823 [Mycena olivaceomarginata]